MLGFGAMRLPVIGSDKANIDEAEATGAEALVTYCPHCEENLSDAIKNSGSKIEMYKLLELVLQSL